MGVGFGELGLGLFEPGIQFFPHLLRPLAFLWAEIVLFANIFGKIIKFVPSILMIINEFPVTLHDDGTGFSSLITIMGIVPVEWTFLNLVTLE